MLVTWSRLVKAGETCDRCDATHIELEIAVAKLKPALLHLGIAVRLQHKEIDEKTFEKNPSESNRIWIAGKALEKWLEADVGMSPCCSVCGDSDCRTLEVGDTNYETVPEELIIKAGLIAASELISDHSTTNTPQSCCVGSCS